MQPYIELSTVLTAAGRRDIAEAIELAGRDRERRDDQGSRFHKVWVTVLSYINGYGIGNYAFRVLYSVFFATAFGAVVLFFSPNARQHSLLWRTGASLHRLLPIISLSKEFEQFFDNPPPGFDEKPNLSRFQVGYFALHAMIGWALGLILLAAMSGITQKG
jgi:hypothetical protein